MKKFLSLVLALVMTMSLVTVSAGAKDFTDDEKITYGEAVNVMSEVGVIDGYTDGTFQPTTNLTRGAAAKIICNLILGPTTAAALGADTAPYSDVPTTNVFAGYIAYCQKTGIISGYADGTFKPAAPLTGYAFMKMLLGALGYNSDVEGYTGSNWSINVAKQAISIGLNKGNDGFTGQAYVNREEAMLYAFNTMQATMVEYPQTTTVVGGDGSEVVLASARKEVSWGSALNSNDGNIKKDGYVQFAEQYFSKLKLNNTTDAFGRPAREWVYDGAKVGTYVKSDLLVQSYTQKVTGRDLYDLLGKTAIEKNDVYVYIDGVDEYARNNNIFTDKNMIKSNTNTLGATGDGVLTEVYFDTVNKEITVAIINTYLAKASKDYDTDKEILDVDVYGYNTTKVNGVAKNIKDLTMGNNTSSMEIDGEEVNVADFKEDDFLLVTIADGEVQTAVAPETLSGATLTAFSLTKKTITTGGTTYGEANTALYDHDVLVDYTASENLKDLTYNIFMDPYGYYIGIELVEKDLQYVFVTGYEPYTKNLTAAKADVGAIFLDGTMSTITVKVDSNLGWTSKGDPVANSWYSYTVGKDNVYTLKPVTLATSSNPTNSTVKAAQYAYAFTDASGKTIDKAHISLPAYGATTVGTGTTNVVYGNADTVYLCVGTTTLNTTTYGDAYVIDSVDSMSTGVKNTNMTVTAVPSTYDRTDTTNSHLTTTTAKDKYTSAGVYTLYSNKGYVIAAIVVGEDAAATSNYVYAVSKNANLETYSADDDIHTWTREVIVNGALTEIKEQGDSLTHIGAAGKGNMTQGSWYKVSYNANGYVTKAEPASDILGDGSYKVVNSISDIKADKTILLAMQLTNATLNMKGWTLYTTDAATNGFAVADNAKAVLIENIDGDYFGEVTYYDSKEDNVADAIKDLADGHNNGTFNGYLSAIFEDGVATTVIICDNVNQPINGGQTPIVPGNNVTTLGDATLVVPSGYNAVSVRISNTGRISYTANLGSANAGKTYSYDVTVKVDNVTVSTDSVSGTVPANGNVLGNININGYYDQGNKVVVYVSNVVLNNAVDDTATLTLALTNVRLSINGKIYADGDTYDAQAGTVVNATILPTQQATADKMVLSNLSINGTNNEVTNSGTAVTIIAMSDGTLTVAYDYDSYNASITSTSADSTWTVTGKPTGKVQAGDPITLILTQKTAADLTSATATLTGAPAGSYTSQLTTQGVTAKNATYDTVQFTSEDLFKAAVATGKLYTDNQNNQADGTLATDGDYQASHNFYLLKTAYVAPVQAVITVTVTMPNAALTVSDITVA